MCFYEWSSTTLRASISAAQGDHERILSSHFPFSFFLRSCLGKFNIGFVGHADLAQIVDHHLLVFNSQCLSVSSLKQGIGKKNMCFMGLLRGLNKIMYAMSDPESLLQMVACYYSQDNRTLWASLVSQMVKNLPATQETWIRSLGRGDPQEKGIVTYSSILAWRIPWTEEPGRLQSMGSQRIEHN